MDSYLWINLIMMTTVTALLIWGVKLLLKNKMSPRGHFLIWSILLLQLLLFPVKDLLPSSSFSVENYVPTVKNTYAVQDAGIAKATEPENSAYIEEMIMRTPLTGKEILVKSFPGGGDNGHSGAEIRGTLLQYSLVISAMLLAFFALSHLCYRRKLKTLPGCLDEETLAVLEHCKRNLNISGSIAIKTGAKAPMLAGFLKPVIYISDGYTREELEHVLTHELCHYKHKDVWFNVLATLILCAFWFNPVMWLCFYVFRRDIEVYCDGRAIKAVKDKRAYATVLLKTAAGKGNFIFATTSFMNGEKEVSQRIKFMAAFQKPKVWVSSLVVLLAVIVGVVCLTNGAGSAEGQSRAIIGGYAGEAKDFRPSMPASDDWGKDAEALLAAYFTYYEAADLPETTKITDCKIGTMEQARPFRDGADGRFLNFPNVGVAVPWDIIYDNAVLYKVGLSATPENPEQYQGFAHEVGAYGMAPPDYDFTDTKERYMVFARSQDAEGRWVTYLAGFVNPFAMEEYSCDYTVLEILQEWYGREVLPSLLTEHKTPYIGNHVAVDEIIKRLPMASYRTAFALGTKEEPYSVTVDYDFTQTQEKGMSRSLHLAEEEGAGADAVPKINPYIADALNWNGTLLLSCIDNAGVAELRTQSKYQGANVEYTYLLDRENAELMSYADNQIQVEIVTNAYFLEMSSVQGLQFKVGYATEDAKSFLVETDMGTFLEGGGKQAVEIDPGGMATWQPWDEAGKLLETMAPASITIKALDSGGKELFGQECALEVRQADGGFLLSDAVSNQIYTYRDPAAAQSQSDAGKTAAAGQKAQSPKVGDGEGRDGGAESNMEDSGDILMLDLAELEKQAALEGEIKAQEGQSTGQMDSL